MTSQLRLKLHLLNLRSEINVISMILSSSQLIQSVITLPSLFRYIIVITAYPMCHNFALPFRISTTLLSSQLIQCVITLPSPFGSERYPPDRPHRPLPPLQGQATPWA